jgi:hypothetical protein
MNRMLQAELPAGTYARRVRYRPLPESGNTETMAEQSSAGCLNHRIVPSYPLARSGLNDDEMLEAGGLPPVTDNIRTARTIKVITI